MQGHLTVCVCALLVEKDMCLAAAYIEDQGFVGNGVIYCEHKTLMLESFFKHQMHILFPLSVMFAEPFMSVEYGCVGGPYVHMCA